MTTGPSDANSPESHPDIQTFLAKAFAAKALWHAEQAKLPFQEKLRIIAQFQQRLRPARAGLSSAEWKRATRDFIARIRSA